MNHRMSIRVNMEELLAPLLSVRADEMRICTPLHLRVTRRSASQSVVISKVRAQLDAVCTCLRHGMHDLHAVCTLLKHANLTVPKISLSCLHLLKTVFLALQNGDVVFHLHKPQPFNPFCGLVWHLSDGINTSTPAVTAKRPLLSSSTSFERADGSQLTSMTPQSCCSYSEFTWQDCIYR